VDCVDRITTRATEHTLAPVRELANRSGVSAVTVRTAWMGHRFDLTVRKGWPGGSREAPVYGWELREVEDTGAPKEGGVVLESPAGGPDACTEAEDAYWAAVEAVQANVAAAPADARS
jgi:hypothetical protein